MAIHKKILVLPDAGPENPFQYQLVDLLRKNNFQVDMGSKRKIGSPFLSVSKYQPDIIYFDWVHSFILGRWFIWSIIKSLVFYLELQYLTKIRRTPIVHTLHNLQNHAGKWLKLEKFVYGYFLKKCTKIRLYSEATKANAIQTFGLDPNKIYVIQDVPYHHYYPNQATREQSRDYLQLSPLNFTYVFLGGIKPYKGIKNLIRAFIEVANDNDRLIIAGKSDSPAYLETIESLAQLKTSIRLYHRFVKEDELQYFLNAADVVVLPFQRIDHSGSVDLAMSFAKSVITLKTPFLKKLLKHQESLLFEKVDDLPLTLQRAKGENLEEIGKTNFILADSTNYKDLIKLFE